jgi:16S rRNA (adenine1518-N6/adenine1519-N6)-dimethyltransferase
MKKKYPEAEPLLDRTRSLLRRYDLCARKGLGQHFLICEEVLETITGAANVSPGDIVLEVGPGLGVLTRELAERAGWVIAVELDDRLAEILKQTLASLKNVSIINRDILEIESLSLIRELEPSFPPAITSHGAYKLVANLPYYITAPVLRHFLEEVLKPSVIVLTIQKEVAEAIVAQPGDMRLLSVSVQFYGKPEIICTVPARCFHPQPEVDSAVIRVTPYTDPAASEADVPGFFNLVRAGFTTPRKQLVNSLTQGLAVSRAEVLSLLTEAGIKPERRAETLSVAEWARLWQIYALKKD